MNSAAITALAAKTVLFAQFSGGNAAVEQLATFGYKKDLGALEIGIPSMSSDEQFELRCAIQDAAKELEATF